MDQIFSFVSKKDHYTADACILWCFDDRFSSLYYAFIKSQNLKHVDLIKVAGGAKDLARPEPESNRAYILDQIAQSVKLHRTPKVFLMMHAECGAYGGATDPHFYAEELKKAKSTVEKNILTIEVRSYFADFGGISEVK